MCPPNKKNINFREGDRVFKRAYKGNRTHMYMQQLYMWLQKGNICPHKGKICPKKKQKNLNFREGDGVEACILKGCDGRILAHAFFFFKFISFYFMGVSDM